MTTSHRKVRRIEARKNTASTRKERLELSELSDSGHSHRKGRK